MRSSPTGNNTLLRIQQEISEVAARENELRNIHHLSNGTSNGNGISDRSPSPVLSPPILSRAISTSSLNISNSSSLNGTVNRRFIPNSNAKGVMQKFFKSRGKIAATNALTGNSTYQKLPAAAWQPTEVLDGPAKALIPNDKPLRKGYVPVEERIQKELKEMKHREEELRSERRKSQPDLMLALQNEQENSNSSSRSESPVPFIGRLRNARSCSQLLDDDFSEDTMSAPSSLRPAGRSLAELCNAPDEEIESPRTLIQQWELRIKKLQKNEI